MRVDETSTMRPAWMVPSLLIALVVGLLTAMTVPAEAGPAPKVDVCHYDADAGMFHKINVNENAFDSHVDHGDSSPGEAVPGHPGTVFDAECSAPELVASASYDGIYISSSLTSGFKLYQDGLGNYSGMATYTYDALSRDVAMVITDACVGADITVRGVVTTVISGDISVGDYMLVSIRDNGDGTSRTRVGAKPTEAELDPFYSTQCGSSPSYPAVGGVGGISFV